MMTALPTMIGSVGASRQTSQPRIAAQNRRTLRGREHRGGRQRQRPDDADEADHRDDADQEHEGEIQKTGRRPRPGTVAAPIKPPPTNCQKTSGSQWMPRSSRVSVWLSAKLVAPNSAMGAPHENICGEGLSAIRTPRKPIRTAIERKRSTFSPSSSAESAVVMSGVAI